jgi:hypothetical protein
MLKHSDMINDFINRKEVKEYLDSAKLYCQFIESTQQISPIEFLKEVRLLLLRLYQNGLSFPLYTGDYNVDADDLLGEEYFTLLKQIQDKLGNNYFYSHIYDPSDLNDNEIVIGDLSDDLGDIYRNLKRALLNLDSDSAIIKGEGLWSLHLLYRSHYGEHIIYSLYAIHFFVQHE